MRTVYAQVPRAVPLPGPVPAVVPNPLFPRSYLFEYVGLRIKEAGGGSSQAVQPVSICSIFEGEAECLWSLSLNSECDAGACVGDLGDGAVLLWVLT